MKTNDFESDADRASFGGESVDGRDETNRDLAEESDAEESGGDAQHLSAGFTRRQMLKITAGAVAAAPLVSRELKVAAMPLRTSAAAAAGQKTPLFFTADEFAMVDELSEIIIPTDAHSPGARAAEVAAFIDARLAEAFEPEVKENFRNGLKLVDQVSQTLNNAPFMKSSQEQRVNVVAQMAKGEFNPQQPEGKFFKDIKEWTVRGYYTSKIGIHTEMEYKGNTYQDQFSGYDAS